MLPALTLLRSGSKGLFSAGLFNIKTSTPDDEADIYTTLMVLSKGWGIRIYLLRSKRRIDYFPAS